MKVKEEYRDRENGRYDGVEWKRYNVREKKRIRDVKEKEKKI